LSTKDLTPTFTIFDGVISFSYGDFGLFQIFTFDVRQQKEERRGLLLSVPYDRRQSSIRMLER